jgi:hypothetical protein
MRLGRLHKAVHLLGLTPHLYVGVYGSDLGTIGR